MPLAHPLFCALDLTAVSRHREALEQWRAVCLETDWFWTMIAGGRIDPWLPEADEQNRTMLRSAAAAAAEMDAGGYDTVLEGIVGPWMLDVVRPVLGPRTPHTRPRHRLTAVGEGSTSVGS